MALSDDIYRVVDRFEASVAGIYAQTEAGGATDILLTSVTGLSSSGYNSLTVLRKVGQGYVYIDTLYGWSGVSGTTLTGCRRQTGALLFEGDLVRFAYDARTHSSVLDGLDSAASAVFDYAPTTQAEFETAWGNASKSSSLFLKSGMEFTMPDGESFNPLLWGAVRSRGARILSSDVQVASFKLQDKWQQIELDDSATDDYDITEVHFTEDVDTEVHKGPASDFYLVEGNTAIKLSSFGATVSDAITLSRPLAARRTGTDYNVHLVHKDYRESELSGHIHFVNDLPTTQYQDEGSAFADLYLSGHGFSSAHLSFTEKARENQTAVTGVNAGFLSLAGAVLGGLYVQGARINTDTTAASRFYSLFRFFGTSGTVLNAGVYNALVSKEAGGNPVTLNLTSALSLCDDISLPHVRVRACGVRGSGTLSYYGGTFLSSRNCYMRMRTSDNFSSLNTTVAGHASNGNDCTVV